MTGTADEAVALLADAGLHGHKYAIDAALTATARRQPGRVVVFTSDGDDSTLRYARTGTAAVTRLPAR